MTGTRWPPAIRNAIDVRNHIIPGETVETEFLEFKRIYDRAERRGVLPGREPAKDIASLANAWGGTLVVGVEETEGKAGDYLRAKGFRSVPEPEDLRQWLESAAVRGHLVPSTLSYTALPVTLDDGTVLILVRVPAFTGGIVALWHPGRADHVAYPWRTSFGTSYLNPDQAVERIMDRTRAFEVRLRRLFEEGKTEVTTPLDVLFYGSGGTPPLCVKILQPGASEFDLSVNDHRLRLPYGAITELWETIDGQVGLFLRYAIGIPARLGDKVEIFTRLPSAGRR